MMLAGYLAQTFMHMPESKHRVPLFVVNNAEVGGIVYA